MVLKTAPKVLIKKLKEAIGTPEDYSKNSAKNHFPEYNNRIPATNDDDDIEAALDGMRISDMDSVEEVKTSNRTMPFVTAG
jgi:hypothetical protein